MGNEEHTWRIGVVAEHAIGVEMPRQDEMRGGTPAGDPAIRRIVDRLDELSELLRGGGDAQTGRAVREMWLAKGRQQPAAYDSADWAGLVGYLDQARALR